MDSKDKLVTLEDLKVVHDGVDALETRMESAEAGISDTVKKSTGGTFDGNIKVTKANTDTSSTQSLFTVGNSIPSGTEGASYGGIQLYCDDDHYVFIRPQQGNFGGNRTVSVPDGTGTLALDDVVTTSANGLMSAADKTKLNGIATGANAYTLPTASSSTLGGIKVGTNLSISNGVLSATNTTYSVATTSANGLMSSSDKTKMNNLTISGPDGGYSWGSIGNVNKYAHIYRCVGLGLVFGTVAMYKTDSSTFNTDAVILTLSSEWRPSAQVGIDMMIKSGGIWYPYYGIISTGGALTQKLSGTCQGVYCSFFFKT